MAPLVTTRKSPGFTKLASAGSIPASPSKSSQYNAPPAQFDTRPELLELDDELLELELEDELLELDEEDELLDDELEELLDEDELELPVPDEPAPPHAESSKAKLSKIRGCFIMVTELLGLLVPISGREGPQSYSSFDCRSEQRIKKLYLLHHALSAFPFSRHPGFSLAGR